MKYLALAMLFWNLQSFALTNQDNNDGTTVYSNGTTQTNNDDGTGVTND